MDGSIEPHSTQTAAINSSVPPSGFFNGPDGIYRMIEKKGEPTEEWLCSPLRVVAGFRNATGSGWGRLVELTDQDGKVHSVAILEKSSAKVKSDILHDHGMRLTGASGARSALLDLLRRWEPDRLLHTTKRLGWAGNTYSAFVLGDGRVLGNQDVIFMNDAASAAAREMTSGGTLTSWKESVAAACIGNPLLILSVSLAFTGPLLQLLNQEGGGLHLLGVTSRGKTSIQHAAVSVWGGPQFLHGWRATANGLEGVAAVCNGTLLALNEIGEVTGRDAWDAAYMLANGKGRARANAAGRGLPVETWRVPILSSGEISLADKVAEGGRKSMAGQQVRLLDIVADTRLFGAFDDLHAAAGGSAFAQQLMEASAKNFGTAGPAFVEFILANSSEVERTTLALMNHIRSAARCRLNKPLDGMTERALTRFALIAAAGELASKKDITGWPKLTAVNAAIDLFAEWCEARDDTSQEDQSQAVERTREYLIAHGASRFEEIGGAPVVAPAGYRDAARFYILPDTWREIHIGHDPQTAAKHLLSSGLLVRDTDGRNLARKLPRAVPGRPRTYEVRAHITESVAPATTSLVSGSGQSDQSDQAS